SSSDLRRRRLMAGTGDDGTDLPTPSTAVPPGGGGTAPSPTPATTTDKAPLEGGPSGGGKLHWQVTGKSLVAQLDEHLDGGCQPKLEDGNKKALQGRSTSSRWFDAITTQEKEEMHEGSITRMHYLMNPNRRASRYYVTADGKRKKRLEVDYLYEESGILQAIRRSGEARVYLWYAFYFLVFRLMMSAFLLLADIVMDPFSDVLLECFSGGEFKQCGPQREGATYVLWAYLINNGVSWILCGVCTHILPQYDERFNVFHIRITQRCMIVLFSAGLLTLTFEYFTYDGSKLRRIYEMVNMTLTVIIYALCRLSTWITNHETSALGDAVQNQIDYIKRSKDVSEEWEKLKESMQEVKCAREEKEKLWNSQPIPMNKKE
ncbi:hypothetical protein PENTCL1PPCAC_11815, partial [Pristionchus entomophagus]